MPPRSYFGEWGLPIRTWSTRCLTSAAEHLSLTRPKDGRPQVRCGRSHCSLSKRSPIDFKARTGRLPPIFAFGKEIISRTRFAEQKAISMGLPKDPRPNPWCRLANSLPPADVEEAHPHRRPARRQAVYCHRHARRADGDGRVVAATVQRAARGFLGFLMG